MSFASATDKPTNKIGDTVVLLHGLGRTKISMKKMEWELRKEGYRVVNASYPSTKYDIETLASKYLQRILDKHVKNTSGNIHFVTHSMGGIVLRSYLKNNEIPNLGRVVMIAPPNKGSEIPDEMKKDWLYKKMLGPAGTQLGTGEKDLPNKLGPVNFELGVIAGAKSANPFFSHLFKGKHDGKVAVEKTKVEGMTDFLEVPYAHTFLMWKKPVINQVKYFLQKGHFKDDKAEPKKKSSV